MKRSVPASLRPFAPASGAETAAFPVSRPKAEWQVSANTRRTAQRTSAIPSAAGEARDLTFLLASRGRSWTFLSRVRAPLREGSGVGLHPLVTGGG